MMSSALLGVSLAHTRPKPEGHACTSRVADSGSLNEHAASNTVVHVGREQLPCTSICGPHSSGSKAGLVLPAYYS
ncbi:hypothetical protein PR003_g13095 [Phytophthora rubi]|uniref:Uncharacterized protein n=1 Tax=Phytophthora rubi TaxID=129364 RepID=A0A6A3KEF7_9STRA|nr:hypothetical protein PR001_g18075 [Phytophthora rubi]KAE9017488.1 hypothetical protein PR002_g13378 [Phytophthora rubi]KAE9335269.1 hypothetical protein PR003_g13095 [Phytophthora rubi]